MDVDVNQDEKTIYLERTTKLKKTYCLCIYYLGKTKIKKHTISTVAKHWLKNPKQNKKLKSTTTKQNKKRKDKRTFLHILTPLLLKENKIICLNYY